MKEIQYKTFSFRTHRKNWKINRPNVCQFELTFRCGLSCNYCYSSCYNESRYIKNELNTEDIKFILNRVHNAGVIWLCFTGGDPLMRPDFLEVYSYAKNKGFIITIFTNGYSMTEEIADYLKKSPPFVIELTLNGVTKNTYEKISGIKGSFEKTIQGINLILTKKLPLKIKTQITKNNSEELPKIKEFVENLGLNFRPSSFLHARLDRDLTPCSLRIRPEEVARLSNGFNLDSLEQDCKFKDNQINRTSGLNNNRLEKFRPSAKQNNSFFRCAVCGGDGVHIDPYGNMFPCICIREPRINLLEKSFEVANKIILNWLRDGSFSPNSKCRDCKIRNYCYSCPGKALLEKGNLEEGVNWFCELTHLVTKSKDTSH